jgi:hypothetical protein
MISICRDHAVNVKRWRDGLMVLRWVAAGMDQARQQFRCVNGYLRVPALPGRPRRHDRRCHTDQGGCRRLITLGPPPKLHGSRDILTRSTTSR